LQWKQASPLNLGSCSSWQGERRKDGRERSLKEEKEEMRTERQRQERERVRSHGR